MDCSICLDRIKKNHTIYTLTCGHKFHYQCFLFYVFKTEGHIFIKCPLCRGLNFKIERPFESSLENIKVLCSRGVGKIRCHHKTKKGNMCRNPSHLLNYGYCRMHHRDILPKENYDLICDYMYYLLGTCNLFRTKIYMLDISKKLLIRDPTIKKIDELQYYFIRYYHYYKSKHNTVANTLDPHDIYDYYKLVLPPKEWVRYCSEKKKII